MKITIEKNARILALFAIACTAIVGFVHLMTKDHIEQQEKRQLLTMLNSVIDEHSYNNELHLDCSTFLDTNQQTQTVYRARLNNKPVAAALTATAPDGYNGKIQLIIGINTQQYITGVRALTHNETPGLGDKIELRKSDWIKSFNGKKVTNEKDSRWQVVKDGGDFDQFTGATITPRAVVKAVKQNALYFSSHQQALFSAENNCGVNNENN